MSLTAWAIFRASLPLQLVALAFAGWAALGVNNYVQRNKGAERVIVKIEKKANEDARTAIEVRSADGKGGRADPFLRK